MDYIGKWRLHSVGVEGDDDSLHYCSPDEYIASPMPYVDENDPEAVADELKERRMLAGSKLEICADGRVLMLAPLPEGVSNEEVEAAVKAGEITLHDGMITGEGFTWEDCGGVLMADPGFGGKFELIDKDGYINYMTFRYVKE